MGTSNTQEKDPVGELIKSIRIPPRPSLLLELQQELANTEPSPRRIASIIASDVGMSGALLKLANSPFYALRRKATSIEQAITILGMNQCIALMTGFMARQAITSGGPNLDQFWDESAMRAKAMVYLAYKTRACPPDIAHTFGLFCNIGVPLLMGRFADYGDTYALAAQDVERTVTAVEDARHATNHAAIGCLLARNWGLSEDISWAILLHHDHKVIADAATTEGVRTLMALSLLAENAMYLYKGHSEAAEWTKGGEYARRHLGLTSDETGEFVEQLQEMFETDH
jgi:HD-like signal output (HDOD) protein